MAGASGTTPARAAPIRASVTGRNGTGTADSTARPVRTRKPRRVASAAVSLASRDLPTPASPARNSEPPRPPAAESTALSSVLSSALRPISDWHSMDSIREILQEQLDHYYL